MLNLQAKVEKQVQPVQESKEQLLTLSFALTGEPSQKQVHIVAGNQKSTWLVKAQGDEKGLYTIGPLSMGRDVLLPKGDGPLNPQRRRTDGKRVLCCQLSDTERFGCL
jgi:hypothetical protein